VQVRHAAEIRQVLRERGTLEPLRGKPGPVSGLTEQRADQRQALVAAEPGLTRQQLCQRLGVGVDGRTIGRWLRRLGLVLKKSRSAPPSRTGPMWPNAAPPGRNC
jgi:transposase